MEHQDFKDARVGHGQKKKIGNQCIGPKFYFESTKFHRGINRAHLASFLLIPISFTWQSSRHRVVRVTFPRAWKNIKRKQRPRRGYHAIFTERRETIKKMAPICEVLLIIPPPGWIVPVGKETFSDQRPTPRRATSTATPDGSSHRKQKQRRTRHSNKHLGKDVPLRQSGAIFCVTITRRPSNCNGQLTDRETRTTWNYR